MHAPLVHRANCRLRAQAARPSARMRDFQDGQAEWTRKEKADGFQVALRIIEETVKDNAHEREEYWIAKLRQVNPELKNSTAGNAHNGRQKYLLKVQAQQRERLQQDAAWLAQILKTFLPKPARMDGRTK